MTRLTREEIVSALGPVDDAVVVELLATGASREEFAQARAWLANDEAPINSGAAMAGGRAARVIDILESLEAELAAEAYGADPRAGDAAGPTF